MHSDPFRLQVLKAVSVALKTITPSNGYMHDMSDFTDRSGRTVERISRGRTSFGDSDPLPMLAVLEDPRAIEANNAKDETPVAANKFRLLVQGFVEDDKDHPLDPAYQLSADAISALVKAKADRFNILGFGGRVTSLSIGQPVHRPGDDEVSRYAYFIFGVTITMIEDLECPRGE
ncbi:minor tail protein [Rhodobacter phage RcCWillis]|nr:minor tail protein [Rhodobacter phage RcCWillis]